ncbi:MAG: GNAT family N-acetyltransferase [Chromatiales bacterium]|jgi:GNAT superfamily N-acetyltransferase
MNIHQAIDILQTEFQYTVSPDCVTVTEHGFYCLMGDLLRALYVEPDYRGCGYGKQLVELAREQHGGPLRLECNTELVRYYEKLGFKRKRTVRRGEYHYMQQDA